MDDELLRARRGDADERHVIVEDETLAQGFTQIPNGVLRRSDLQPGAKLTYMVLLSYAWQQDQAFPGQDRLARDMGVSERSVITYLKQLQETGLVSIRRRGLGLTNVYVLHRIPGSEKSASLEVQDLPVLEVQNLPPNKTQREKDTVDSSNDSKGRSGRDLLDEETLRAFVEDYARELNDQAAIGSTLTRVLTIYRQSGRPLEDFADIMQAARLRTQKRSGSIRAEPVGEGMGRKPKMAYFLAVLSDLALGGDRSKAGD